MIFGQIFSGQMDLRAKVFAGFFLSGNSISGQNCLRVIVILGKTSGQISSDGQKFLVILHTIKISILHHQSNP
jgi:hypothetical protein